MFESAVLEKLRSDSVITSKISTFQQSSTAPSIPAIFANYAPEKAELPYIVFTIDRYEEQGNAIDLFNVSIDYFDRNTSHVNADIVSQAIEFLLDTKILQHERYDSIRLYYSSGGSVAVGKDKRDIHFNNSFQARAGRKAWMQQL